MIILLEGAFVLSCSAKNTEPMQAAGAVAVRIVQGAMGRER